jgi:hypothetical protein
MGSNTAAISNSSMEDLQRRLSYGRDASRTEVDPVEVPC